MQLGAWQKSAVYVTTVTISLSGAIWFLVHDLIADEPGEFTRTLLTVHGIASYALLVVLGSMLPLHVRAGWRHRRNLWTGIAILTMMVVLAISALILYYGGEDIREPAKWVHLGFGTACAVVFPLHVVWQRRRKSITSSSITNIQIK